MRTLLTTLGLILLLLAPAAAEDDPLARASKLRADSEVDWKAKRYAEAAAKLREAATIYEGLEEPPAKDLAVTLRALIWNEKDAGEFEGVTADYIRLMRLVKANPDLDSELQSALDALWAATTLQQDLAAGKTLLEPILEAANAIDHQVMVGQMLHNLGSHARNKGNLDESVDYFEQAVAKRIEIQDRVGLGWSLNNLANLHLQYRKEALPALDALDQAHALVHEEGVILPQVAVGVNILTAIDMLTGDGSTAPAKDARKWIERLAKRLAKSKTGARVSLARLGRAWLAWTAATGKASDVAKVGKQLIGLVPASMPAEVKADITIRAAQAVLDAGRSKTATSWLKGIECGEGLCSSHLIARTTTLTALIAAAQKSKKSRKALFVTAAEVARLAWDRQLDRRGRKDAYRALLDAAVAADAVVELAEVQKSLNELEGEGVPGGPGGFATSSGNLKNVNRLALDDVLFTIRRVEGGIEVHDVAAGTNQTAKVVWMPKNIGFNGLSLTLFGGYVVVKDLNYGGGASASGMLGEIRLDELGDYHPVPGAGVLLVQKNGAVRYRAK